MVKKSILIVEDSHYLAESLSDMLELNNYKPIIAPSGREAIKLALKNHPALILLDIRLPDIDGYEVYQSVRADTWGKDVKIMVLTASESIENISKNIDLDPEYILFKPDWSMEDILQKIKSRLND